MEQQRNNDDDDIDATHDRMKRPLSGVDGDGMNNHTKKKSKRDKISKNRKHDKTESTKKKKKRKSKHYRSDASSCSSSVSLKNGADSCPDNSIHVATTKHTNEGKKSTTGGNHISSESVRLSNLDNNNYNMNTTNEKRQQRRTLARAALIDFSSTRRAMAGFSSK